MKKTAIALSCALALCMGLFGCGGSPSQQSGGTAQQTEPQMPLKVIAADDAGYDDYVCLDEQNSVVNRATFYESGGWLYGEGFADDGSPQFVKVRSDMTDWTVLSKIYAVDITQVDNYLYYMGWSKSDYGIYKMKTSGEGKKKLAKAYGSMQVVGNHIYYTNNMINGEYVDEAPSDKDHHLYRCTLNGKKKTEVIAKPVYYPFVFEDGILYQDDRDNCSLHVCDLNGENDVKLNDCVSYFPLYDGEYIYYVAEAEPGKVKSSTIRKIRPDGSEDQEVAPYPVSHSVLMKDDYIYFAYADDSNRLYRINKDGSGLTLITQDKKLTDVCLLGDRIKYSTYTSDGKYIDKMYLCELDGSGKTELRDN